MDIVKAEIPRYCTFKQSAYIVLIVLSFVCFMPAIWTDHSKTFGAARKHVKYFTDVFPKTPWLSKNEKENTKWLKSTVQDDSAEMDKIDVTAVFADDPELRKVNEFTVDPLKPFFPNEIYRTNADGTSYENWMAMDFPPNGTIWNRNYRTPCFTNATDGRFRCVPKAYVIGWPKCGSTQMWWYMSRHSELAHAERKETNFLTIRNFMIKQGYAGDPDIPAHTSLHYLRKINPNTQIIALMRNPASAALSLFNHGIKMRQLQNPELPRFLKPPKTAMDIHKYFVQSIHYFDECVKKKSMRACCHLPGYDRNKISDPKYFFLLRMYIYYIHLEEVFKNFSPSQVHLIKSEKFYEDELSTLHRLFTFLNISTGQAEILVKKKKGEVSNKRPPYIQPAVETYQMLSEFYKPFNKRLAKMLGEERWLKWNVEAEQQITEMKSTYDQ